MTRYLDYNAATPVDSRILDEMTPWHSKWFGNAASRDHGYGWNAIDAVENARWLVGELIHANSNDIFFTGSATESVNLALTGVARKCKGPGTIIITVRTEHDAVLATCRHLQCFCNEDVRYLPVDGLGRANRGEIYKQISGQSSLLVAIMLANNEIGTIHGVSEIAEIAHAAGALLFSDITQAVGKIPVDVQVEGIDLAAFSAHKIYGPKGVGALYIRGGLDEIQVEPLIHGGGQERGLRGGTLNVPGIVGFGEACRIAAVEMEEECSRVCILRDQLEQAILSQVPDSWVNGDTNNRIGNTSNIGFRGVEAKALIRDMHDIAVSTQAACSTGAKGPSHVLKAIGLTDDEAYSCIRFSLGRFTTGEEIDYTIGKVVRSVQKLRR